MGKKLEPPGRLWAQMFLMLGLLTGLTGWRAFQPLSTLSRLKTVQGVVTLAEWRGSRGRSFVFQVGGDHRVYQPITSLMSELPPEEMIKSGANVRLQHGDETAGLTSRIRVYALSVDGQQVYSSEQYRRSEIAAQQSNRYKAFPPFLAATLFCFWRWRKSKAEKLPFPPTGRRMLARLPTNTRQKKRGRGDVPRPRS